MKKYLWLSSAAVLIGAIRVKVAMFLFASTEFPCSYIKLQGHIISVALKGSFSISVYEYANFQAVLTQFVIILSCYAAVTHLSESGTLISLLKYVTFLIMYHI